MPRFLRPLSLFALLLFSIFSLGAFGTDEPDGDGKAKPFLLTNDERAAILDLFNATEETVSKEGVVELVYNFETEERTLSDDWIPPLTRKNRAVRWSRDWEGSAEGLAGGILIADSGQWFHSAVWQPEVEIEATYVSFCGGSRGDMVVAVYAWTKGLKRRVGSNLGMQLLRISGVKAAGGIGKAPEIIYEEPARFGFKLEGGTFRCQREGRVKQETDSSKFLKKLANGQVGFVWRGNISGCLAKVTMRGKLDLEHAAKSITGLAERLEEHRKANLQLQP